MEVLGGRIFFFLVVTLFHLEFVSELEEIEILCSSISDT